jgi:hypothetical protein
VVISVAVADAASVICHSFLKVLFFCLLSVRVRRVTLFSTPLKYSPQETGFGVSFPNYIIDVKKSSDGKVEKLQSFCLSVFFHGL